MTAKMTIGTSENKRNLTRVSLLKLASTSLEVKAFRFAREALLEWLGRYPGDLQASLYYAQALLEDGQDQQGLVVLEGLYRADPENIPVVETLVRKIARASGVKLDSSAASLWFDRYFALTGRNLGKGDITEWAQWLSEVRFALRNGEVTAAQGMLQQLLETTEVNELIAVTHMVILKQDTDTPLNVKCGLGEIYLKQFPDSLVCMLLLADWLMQVGDSGRAVALLHQAAARDVGGQVAERLWGREFAYRNLWPEALDLNLGVAVPAEIAQRMGWNRLPSAVEEPLVKEENQPQSHFAQQAEQTDVPLPEWLDFTFQEVEAAKEEKPAPEMQAPSDIPKSPPDSELEEAAGETSAEPEKKEDIADSTIQAVRQEFERLAKKLNRADFSQEDARFPVYVILSSRHGLERAYGSEGGNEIEKELNRLVLALQRRRGWDACTWFLDDETSSERLGLYPLRTNDPWEIKLAIRDLDASLAKRGEMIGAILILGGDDIVPFHKLPNPVDDDDTEVASDNPYASRDENYFIPEWSVGRLPAGQGISKEWLLDVLEQIRLYHENQARKKPWYKQLLETLMYKFWFNLNGSNANLGYAAAAWRDAARAVYNSIGDPDELYFSPPMGYLSEIVTQKSLDQPVDLGTLYGVPVLSGRMGYFNLHGMRDAAEWFGQADLEEYFSTPLLPIALSPEHLRKPKNILEGNVPQVIVSEACYGAHIQGRSQDQALALKFLQAGALAFVGSTCMSYGTIEEPLQAADLLAQAFWRFLRDGIPAGEALRQAKIHLAMEMDKRQGFLDGEDQKTLISFVLYGDPLALPAGMRLKRKSLRREAAPPADLEVVCDRVDSTAEPVMAPDVMVTYVRDLVARYLPGMEDAQIKFASEHKMCNGNGHTCPASQLHKTGAKDTKSTAEKIDSGRQLVTLSKCVTTPKGIDNRYARLTLDEEGKLVKLVISR